MSIKISAIRNISVIPVQKSLNPDSKIITHPGSESLISMIE